MDAIKDGAAPQSLNLMNIRTYYNHRADTEGTSRLDDKKGSHSLRLVDNRIFGYATYFFPSVINFLKNHEDITAYPMDFVNSKKFTTPLKVFHMTLGTLVAGAMEAVYHTISLVVSVSLIVFFVVKSLFDRDARKLLPHDLKVTLKKEVSYHINGLIKGVLQAIPGAGIFLPTLYNGTVNALKSRIYDLCGTKEDQSHQDMDEDMNKQQRRTVFSV